MPATKRVLDRVVVAVLLSLLLSPSALAAQQPATDRQKPPRLTTDDVRPPAEQPPPESKEDSAKPEETGKTRAVEPKAGQPNEATKVSAEESSWRDRVNKARDRAKELQRAAEEAELQVTALRNDLGTSGESAKYRNETAAEITRAGQRVLELRSQARDAEDDLTQLVDYGKQKAFSEAEEPKPTAEEGKPNEQYYLAQFAKLTEALQTAERRIQLYDNRIRDLSQQISTNSGGRDKSGRSTGGDSFFMLQLQKDREEAQQKLDESRAGLAKAQADLDALRDEARRAGVPPGLFR
jgi:hypothetical protein